MQQKPTQECKAIFLQLKNKLEKIKKKAAAGPVGGGQWQGFGVELWICSKSAAGF